MDDISEEISLKKIYIYIINKKGWAWKDMEYLVTKRNARLCVRVQYT